MAKARRALASAKLLLDSGDVDGACNRSYYAMFDAARAALLSLHAPVPVEVARTHSGLITAFSLHLVKPGLIAVEHGRSLNKVEDLRLIADYKGDPIKEEHATWALVQASQFFACNTGFAKLWRIQKLRPCQSLVHQRWSEGFTKVRSFRQKILC